MHGFKVYFRERDTTGRDNCLVRTKESPNVQRDGLKKGGQFFARLGAHAVVRRLAAYVREF